MAVDLRSDERANETRECGQCGQAAVRVFHVTHHTVNGIPAGRTYEHRCHACGAQFRTLSMWRTIRELFFITVGWPITLLMLAFGIGSFDEKWWLALVAGIIALVLGGVSYSTGRAMYALVKNPKVA